MSKTFSSIGDEVLSVTATTGRVKLPISDVIDIASNGNNLKVGNRIRLINVGDPCYFKLGDSTVVATTGNTYLPNGSIEMFEVGTQTHVAAINDTSNSSSLKISVGNGE